MMFSSSREVVSRVPEARVEGVLGIPGGYVEYYDLGWSVILRWNIPTTTFGMSLKFIFKIPLTKGIFKERYHRRGASLSLGNMMEILHWGYIETKLYLSQKQVRCSNGASKGKS